MQIAVATVPTNEVAVVAIRVTGASAASLIRARLAAQTKGAGLTQTANLDVKGLPVVWAWYGPTWDALSVEYLAVARDALFVVRYAPARPRPLTLPPPIGPSVLEVLQAASG